MIPSNRVQDKNDRTPPLLPPRREFLKFFACVSAAGLILPPSITQASLRPNRITDLRVWTAPDHTRVVFDLSQMAKHNLFRLSNPERLVVDLLDVSLDVDPARMNQSDPVVTRIRTGTPSPNVVRTVFELNSEIRPRSFVLKATGDKNHRLVLDLFRKEFVETENVAEVPKKPNNSREAVIVIDPGHGGEDPGAIGFNGTMEKDVAFQVAKRMAQQINQTPGFRAFLTRTGDYYVSLRRRVAIARQHSADLFVSLHADAFRTADARGASVYTLSESGKPTPDRAINNLVQRENSADMIGGVDLNLVSDPEVRGILMDLSQRDSLNRALVYGKNLLQEMANVSSLNLHFNEVKQAGFAVLKAPDIPSVLVELAFLSNRKEEGLLRQQGYQESLARALALGTRKFVQSSRLV
ncbi:MAG: N-acetylmuramoyl-L-alanine amidase [Magnetococcales bacterium]|nr:N-acetylmuramoyl-L-alanine amidase [Magnetococcales bacterium]HIJ84071.1 N-acetylmuramoyl-L-alanine amidase [Magnetococcales bacterium]